MFVILAQSLHEETLTKDPTINVTEDGLTESQSITVTSVYNRNEWIWNMEICSSGQHVHSLWLNCSNRSRWWDKWIHYRRIYENYKIRRGKWISQDHNVSSLKDDHIEVFSFKQRLEIEENVDSKNQGVSQNISQIQ